MNQKKTLEARDKFVSALVADPYSRMTWDRIARWAEETNAKTAPVEITPPGSEAAGTISIDEKLLRMDDGTLNWKIYNEVRKSQVVAKGSGDRTLAGEASALKKVAEAVRNDIKAGKIKYPDKSLTNLVRLDDAGLLEPYILLLRSDDSITDEYESYRERNRDKLRKFIVEFLLGLPN